MMRLRKIGALAMVGLLTYVTAPHYSNSAVVTGTFYSVRTQPQGGFYSARNDVYQPHPIPGPAYPVACRPLPCGVPTCTPEGYPINYLINPCANRPRFSFPSFSSFPRPSFSFTQPSVYSYRVPVRNLNTGFYSVY